MRQFIKSYLFLLVLTGISYRGLSQSSINQEVFTGTFSSSANGGKMIYKGKSHAFTLDVAGKGTTEQQAEHKVDNQFFFKSWRGDCSNIISGYAATNTREF